MSKPADLRVFGDAQSWSEAPARRPAIEDRPGVGAARVLVVAYSNWEGLARTPSLYRSAGWVVEVFTRPRSFLSQTSNAEHIHLGSYALDDFVEDLRRLLERQEHRYGKVVLADDPLLWELGRRRAESWARALLPCAPTDQAIDFLTSKISFIRDCAAAGLPVPRSHICSGRDAMRAAAETLGLPVVIKQNEGFSGQGVSIVDSIDALLSLPMGDQVIVQEFVAGSVCSAAALFADGRLQGFYSYRRVRTWGPLGASAAIQFKVFPELEAVLESLGRLTGFDGLCGIDFIEQEGTGRILLLEQNFRPTLTMLLGPRVGVDFAQLLRFRHAPPDASIPRQDPALALEVPLFPTDVVRAISEKDLPGVLCWLVKPSWWRELTWYDRGLLWKHVRFITRFLVEKLLRFLRAGRSATAG